MFFTLFLLLNSLGVVVMFLYNFCNFLSNVVCCLIIKVKYINLFNLILDIDLVKFTLINANPTILYFYYTFI